jgi:peptidoglycan biosynthesis protein MviN/MurJ (putative lipid II flippase)
MQETPRRLQRQTAADLLMLLLCSFTSFWLLASPLVPYVFDYGQFLVADVALTAVLGLIGVKLNHLAARNVRVTFGRGRRR